MNRVVISMFNESYTFYTLGQYHFENKNDGSTSFKDQIILLHSNVKMY